MGMPLEADRLRQRFQKLNAQINPDSTHFKKEIHFVHSDSDPMLNTISYVSDNHATGTTTFLLPKSLSDDSTLSAMIELVCLTFYRLCNNR